MNHLAISWLLILMFFVSRWRIDGAAADAEVTQFPGFTGQLPSKHYAGYITVGNKPQKMHLYYYFATSERSLDDPLTFWVNGGPGCSLFCALLELIGPVYISHDLYHTGEAKLKRNAFSWTKVSNILFVDIPAGAGYSYADNKDDYMTDDTKTVANLYEFIVKWFSEYPEFLPNSLYLAGCSYSGVLVPPLAQLIVNGIEAGELSLNFKGFSIGNGAIDQDLEKNERVPFAHRMGLISEDQYKDMVTSCGEKFSTNNDPDCLRSLEIFKRNLEGVHIEHVVYQPCCFHLGINMEADGDGYMRMHHHQILLDRKDDSIQCHNLHSIQTRLLDPNSSRQILHAMPVEVTGEWKRCIDRLSYERDIASLIPYYENLTMRGYRIFVYSGDHDMLVPYTAMLKAIKLMNYSAVEQWRPWYVGNQLAGYMVRYEHNLLFATLKGAGHTPMAYMRREALVAYQRWIEGADFL